MDKKNEMENLESEAAKFIGTDKYFEEEINAIKNCKRYITSKQMRRFFTDYLKEYAPRTILEYDEEKNIGRLVPDNQLNQLIIESYSSSGGEVYSIPSNGIKVTFDADAAFENPNIEFINVLHPLVLLIVNEYENRLTGRTTAQHVLLQSNFLDHGFYYFFAFRLTERSAKTKNTLESIFLDENLNEVGDIIKGEQILGEMVEKGQDPQGGTLEIDSEFAREACEKAEQLLVQRLERIRRNAIESNDRFIQNRINNLEVHYDRILNRKEELLENAIREEKSESYKRRLRTTIQNKENEKRGRVQALESQREVNVGYEAIASGILEVLQI